MPPRRRMPPLPLAPAGLPDLKGLVVGLPREYYPADLDPGVRAGLDRTIAAVRAQGAEVREVSLPHSKYAVPTYYIVAPAEAASNLARFDGVRYGLRRLKDGDDVADMYRRTRGEGFGPEVRRRILVGTYVLSAGYYDAYYGKAQAVRRADRRGFPQGVRRRRGPAAHADHADTGVQGGREGRRPGVDVLRRRLRLCHQPRGAAGDEHSRRPKPGTADRGPDHRAHVRRAAHARRRRRCSSAW